MKYSSKKLGKILGMAEDELESLMKRERDVLFFNAAVGEDVESVRPAYDFAQTQKEKDLLEAKIRKIKHALNVYNATTVVPEIGMTIDQALIYLPQLVKKKSQYFDLKNAQVKARVPNAANKLNLIDYKYANYDIAEAAARYDEASAALAKAQMSLDKANSVEAIELDLD